MKSDTASKQITLVAYPGPWLILCFIRHLFWGFRRHHCVSIRHVFDDYTFCTPEHYDPQPDARMIDYNNMFHHAYCYSKIIDILPFSGRQMHFAATFLTSSEMHKNFAYDTAAIL